MANHSDNDDSSVDKIVMEEEEHDGSLYDVEVYDDGPDTDEYFSSSPKKEVKVKKFFDFFGWYDSKVKEANDDGVTMSIRFDDGEEVSWTMNGHNEYATEASIKVASKGYKFCKSSSHAHVKN